MRNLTDVISNSKKKEFNVEIEIHLEANNKMKSNLVVNETTSSFAKQKAEMLLAENNIMKFEITSIKEVDAETETIQEEEEAGDESDLRGKRIKLIQMNEDPNPVEPGTQGTIMHVDGIGQIHVKWDNGRTLAVVPGVDEYEILDSQPQQENSNQDLGGRYLSIHKLPNRLSLKLTQDGIMVARSMKDDGRSDVEIMDELFEDIRSNSEMIWHYDLGEAGFGLTNAPGITIGYYPAYSGEEGDSLYKTDDEEYAELYYFNDYAIRSEVEDLLNGELILTKFEE